MAAHCDSTDWSDGSLFVGSRKKAWQVDCAADDSVRVPVPLPGGVWLTRRPRWEFHQSQKLGLHPCARRAPVALFSTWTWETDLRPKIK